ncbi:NAD-glutamate dehydrogenase domain-containing protein [Gordonia liuliyuniae]|uniref:NAD-glutamate dehydrogenase n=1 Tax=Gordonia liuliyuniae TaxID=2911517 RepID=A0ABS9IRW3_9ACTN|nr:NAD-glutamate dehydrogenase domain-containing protein [Gordonia liuliyuniae]MCF8588299.1 NAD-glutamate dehydrogenase [Gordonia liuliyuniae]
MRSELAARYRTGAGDVSAEQIDRRLERHLAVGENRSPGEILVSATRVDGGEVDVHAVLDDVPLLVESILTAVSDAGYTIVAIDHPQLTVARDPAGRLVGLDDHGIVESWITVVTAPSADSDPAALESAVTAAASRATSVRDDTAAMRERLAEVIASIADAGADLEQIRLLEWFGSRSNFVGVGYRAATIDPDGGEVLGVWRDRGTHRPTPVSVDSGVDVDRVWLATGLLRGQFPTLVRATRDGVEHQFLGIITATGAHQSIYDIPGVRVTVNRVLDGLGFAADSYGGMATVELLQSFPLVELFAADPADLTARVSDLLDAQSARTPRFHVRPGVDGHTVSAMVFMAREAYSTAVRIRLTEIIKAAHGGQETEFTTRLSQAPLAQLQLLMHVPRPVVLDDEEGRSCQKQLTDAVRTWDDRVRERWNDQVREGGHDTSPLRLLHYVSERYRDGRDPAAAAADLPIATALASGDLHVAVDVPDTGVWTFTLYLCDRQAALTDVLPVLQSLGLTVVDEHPFTIDRPDGAAVAVYEFTVTPAPGIETERAPDLSARVADAFEQMWLGHADVDRLSELVLRAGLTSRWVAMLRTYARYLGQCGFGYSLSHIAGVLGDQRAATDALVDLFAASFDPDEHDDARRDEASARLDTQIAGILSLDADRVMSALAALVRATLRTTFYTESDGWTQPTIAVKLRTGDVPQAPQPRPKYEIFVHSPLVEGVHLRFGDVSRGGLRWSDRLEDFRTEILGLVKAQAVKNAVIVPVGAKGGFVVRRGPATRDDAIECYRAFIASLLQMTDDLDPATGQVVPPRRVVRRDGDDTYLVVAADKGTASFSDIANEVSAHYGFWLGDAFASGGSVGYDHKAMGITARGAWESVKRHFREMGVDVQTQDFTAVAIGDMSGDVFGNGMLASRHTRLVGAFDHRHIFVDPDPDAATSYLERERLFRLPRSSWADYDTSLISAGGGVWGRDVKSIPISAQMRTALGLADDVTELEPPELIRAVLAAPADLLFNGGIGTYVKASDEADVDVGDKANDPIRVVGAQLRVKVVGEGGNLGVTEHGRIEADLCGVRINSDAMDNSAGVDCSDHEVNIKVLLDSQIASGALDADDRVDFLESMTDDVTNLVLADNIAQNAELGLARATADDDVELHARILAELADHGVDLELEALPYPRRLRARRDGDLGRGLTSPELATVMAHVKLQTKGRLLATTLPDNDLFTPLAAGYFPAAIRERFPEGIAGHRLRREIVTTRLVNRIVDGGGIGHLLSVQESTGADTGEGARAFVVADGVFGVSDLIDEIRQQPVPAVVGDEMTRRVRRLLSTSSRWLLAHRPQPLATAAEITRYSDVAGLVPDLSGWLRRVNGDNLEKAYLDAGAAPSVARAVAEIPYRVHLLDVHDLADIADREPAEVGELLFAVLDHFGIDRLIWAVDGLDRGDRWHLLARVALHDDLLSVLRGLTGSILSMSEPDESSQEKIAEWSAGRSTLLARARATLDDLTASAHWDIATLSVAVRSLRSVIG